MTTIVYKGKEEKAYSMLMRKENALDIISGKKPIEIRTFSDHYVAMLVDQSIIDKNEKEEDPGNHECPIRKDVRCIHFHNYNNSWYLDVAFSEADIYSLVEDDIEILQEEFDFHELDEELAKCKDTPEDERPMFFWFKIGQILSHNLTL